MSDDPIARAALGMAAALRERCPGCTRMIGRPIWRGCFSRRYQPPGEDVARWLRRMIMVDMSKQAVDCGVPVTTTLRCVAAACGLRFVLAYLPAVNPPCPRCGAAATLASVMRS